MNIINLYSISNDLFNNIINDILSVLQWFSEQNYNDVIILLYIVLV